MESIVKPFEPSMLCLVFKAFFLQAFEINVYNILEEVQKMQESIKTLEEKVKENERKLLNKCEKKICKKIFKKIKKTDTKFQKRIEMVAVNIGEKLILNLICLMLLF